MGTICSLEFIRVTVIAGFTHTQSFDQRLSLSAVYRGVMTFSAALMGTWRTSAIFFKQPQRLTDSASNRDLTLLQVCRIDRRSDAVWYRTEATMERSAQMEANSLEREKGERRRREGRGFSSIFFQTLLHYWLFIWGFPSWRNGLLCSK